MPEQFGNYIVLDAKEEITLDHILAIADMVTEIVRNVKELGLYSAVTSAQLLIRKMGTREDCSITDPITRTVGFKIEVKEATENA